MTTIIFFIFILTALITQNLLMQNAKFISLPLIF